MKTTMLLIISLLFLNFSLINNDIEEVFSKTKKIEIYAFNNFRNWDNEAKNNYYNKGKIVIPNKYLKNKVVLNEEQTLKLKNNLNAIRYKEAKVKLCYDQLHSIVFYNKSGKVIGYVNICFENFNTIPSQELESSERLVYGLIFQKELFREFGITYFKETSDENK